jgi:hypothetical protein
MNGGEEKGDRMHLRRRRRDQAGDPGQRADTDGEQPGRTAAGPEHQADEPPRPAMSIYPCTRGGGPPSLASVAAILTAVAADADPAAADQAMAGYLLSMCSPAELAALTVAAVRDRMQDPAADPGTEK